MIRDSERMTTMQPGQASSPSMAHGAANDPRYPSTRKLRTGFAFAVDLLLSLGALVGGFFGGQHVPALSTYPTLVAIAAMIIVSLVNRVLIQWVFRTSIGKALFGLCLVSRSDGGRPGLWALLKAWLLSIWWTIAITSEFVGSAVSGAEPNLEVFPSVVRMCDVRALRRAHQ